MHTIDQAYTGLQHDAVLVQYWSHVLMHPDQRPAGVPITAAHRELKRAKSQLIQHLNSFLLHTGGSL